MMNLVVPLMNMLLVLRSVLIYRFHQSKDGNGRRKGRRKRNGVCHDELDDNEDVDDASSRGSGVLAQTMESASQICQ